MAARQTEDFHYGDNSYLAYISQYKDNQALYDKLLQNPFLNSRSPEFEPTFWQRFGSLLGDDSAEASYYADLMSKRNQWASDALEAFRQQEYNEPSAQTARMKAAGFNPDLNGGANISPGSAAQNDQPMQGISWPSGSEMKQTAEFGLSFVTSIISMAKSFQSLKMGELSLESGGFNVVKDELDSNEKARDFVLNQIAGMSFFTDPNYEGDLSKDIIDAASKVDYSPYSSRTRKLIKRYFGLYSKYDGKNPLAVEKLKSELRSAVAKNNKSAIDEAGSPLFNEDFNEWLRGVASIFGKYEFMLQKADYDARLSKAGYDKKFFDSLDPAAAAAAENSQNVYNSSYFHGLDPGMQSEASNDEARSRSSRSKSDYLTEEMWNDIYKLCKSSKSWYGTLGLILIPYFRSALSGISSGAGSLIGAAVK